MMNVADRVGSLESGAPLSTYTQVLQAWVECEKVFDHSNATDRAYATGGYRVYEGGATHVHE